MKLNLLASTLALLILGLPAPAQPAPAPKVKAAAEATAENAAELTDKAVEKAKTTVKKAKEKAAESTKPLPFYGEVAAVDATAKTVSIGETVYHLTEATKIVNGGKAAKFSDIKVGRKIGGSCVLNGDKKELIRLNVGVKQEFSTKEKAAETKPKAKAAAEAEETPAPAAPPEAAPETKPAAKKKAA